MMSVRAYILIQTEVGHAEAVATAARAIPGVASSENVTGPYDVVIRAEAESMDELGRMAVRRLQLLEGIVRTVTCPVVDLS